MGDRRFSARYGTEDFDNEEWERELRSRNARLLEHFGDDVILVPRNSFLDNLLQRYTDRGRRFPDDFFDVPDPSTPAGFPALPAIRRTGPYLSPPGATPGPRRPESSRNRLVRREEEQLRAAIEASIREEREAQERRDAEEAARLDALERQAAADYAYARALQGTSSDSDDSDVPPLWWQPPPAPNDGRLSKRNKTSSSTATPSNPTAQTADCAVCFNSFEYPNSIARLSCSHYYCTECLSGLFAGAISGAISRLNPQPFPPSCCKDHPIVYDVVERWLSSEVRRNYIHNRALLETPSEERVYCARDSCGQFIAPPQRSTVGIFGSRFADGRRLSKTSKASSTNTLVRCTSCSMQTCTQCKRPADEHNGGAGGVCPEDADIKKLMSTAQQRGWQQCYRCKNMVEKTDGCNHMT